VEMEDAVESRACISMGGCGEEPCTKQRKANAERHGKKRSFPALGRDCAKEGERREKAPWRGEVLGHGSSREGHGV
jgi:hypothetical protein